MVETKAVQVTMTHEGMNQAPVRGVCIIIWRFRGKIKELWVDGRVRQEMVSPGPQDELHFSVETGGVRVSKA